VVSLRQLGACLVLPSTFSIVRDFFGYRSPPPWPPRPTAAVQSNVPTSLSVLRQAQLLQQPHFNLHVVRVGVDDTGFYTLSHFERQVDAAVQLARNIYGEINVGIGRVHRAWVVPLSDGTGFEFINPTGEANDLIDAYELPPDGIKVFFVTGWGPGGTVGHTDGDDDGCAVLLQKDDFVGTGRSLAHEIGHVMGFGHENSDPTNVMCQSGTAKTGLGITSDNNLIPATTGFNDNQTVALRGFADTLGNLGARGIPVIPAMDPFNEALRWMWVRC
jgi:hypothetical protein